MINLMELAVLSISQQLYLRCTSYMFSLYNE